MALWIIQRFVVFLASHHKHCCSLLEKKPIMVVRHDCKIFCLLPIVKYFYCLCGMACWYLISPNCHISLVLMHSCVINGHHLLCDAHTVLEKHRGTAATFLYYSLLSFSAISFCIMSLWHNLLFYFLGWLNCFFYIQTRKVDLVLRFPIKTFSFTDPWPKWPLSVHSAVKTW